MSWGERSCIFSGGCPVDGGPTMETCNVSCQSYAPNGTTPDSQPTGRPIPPPAPEPETFEDLTVGRKIQFGKGVVVRVASIGANAMNLDLVGRRGDKFTNEWIGRTCAIGGQKLTITRVQRRTVTVTKQ